MMTKHVEFVGKFGRCVAKATRDVFSTVTAVSLVSQLSRHVPNFGRLAEHSIREGNPVSRGGFDFRRARLAALTVSLGLVLGPVPSHASHVGAQDPFGGQDPFQAGADPFGSAPGNLTGPVGPTTAADATAAMSPLVDAIVRQDLSRPADRLSAAETLFLLGQPQEANRLLAEFKQPLTGSEAYDMVLQVGSLRLLQLQLREDVSADAKNWMQATLAAAMSHANSDAAIADALTRLESEQANEWSSALERLAAVGVAAAEPLMSRIQGYVDRGELQSPAVRRLIQVTQGGAEQWDITLRSLVGGNTPYEAAAILALASRFNSGLNQAAVAEYMLREPAERSEAVVDAVGNYWSLGMQRQFGIDPRSSSSMQAWLKSLNRQQIERWQTLQEPRYMPVNAPESHWVWDISTGGILPQELDGRQRISRDYVTVATAWLRADVDGEETLRNFVAAQFQRAKMVNGMDRPIPSAAVDLAAEFLTLDQMLEMLDDSLEQSRWLVAQSLVEALEQKGNADLLSTRSGRLSPIVTALRAADPRVRAAAVRTILQWRPSQGFAGSSYFNRELVEVMSASRSAGGLIASMNAYHAQYLAALVRNLGWEASTVSSAEALAAEFDAYPAAFLVVTDSLGEVPYLAVVDKLRSSPKGKSIPILLMVRPENFKTAVQLFQVDRVDPFTMVVEFSEEGKDLIPAFERLALYPSLQTSGAGIPTDQMSACVLTLKEWLADPVSRRLLDFDLLAPAAQGIMTSEPTLSVPAIEVLSFHPNPQSQVFLASIASEATQPRTVREHAAKAFRTSVERFGTLLTSQQIQQQYQRQNESQLEGAFTQGILNSILDTLEARYHQTPFDQLPPIPVSQ